MGTYSNHTKQSKTYKQNMRGREMASKNLYVIILEYETATKAGYVISSLQHKLKPFGRSSLMKGRTKTGWMGTHMHERLRKGTKIRICGRGR